MNHAQIPSHTPNPRLLVFNRQHNLFPPQRPVLLQAKALHPLPGTTAQLDQAQLHHRAILAWQQLPHSVQLQWRELAKSVPSHRPPYDNNHHISGYNLFVSAYHGFAQLGREHIPEPQPFPEFPSAALELLQIIPGT